MTNYDLIVRNGQIVTEQSVINSDIAVKDGKIVKVSPVSIEGNAKKEINAEGLHVFPGLIDTHVHLNETVVTAMCRNGYEFGIRIAGMGDEWFTAPVNTPQGLFFTGYDQSMACPDMGDSAITETFGVGGMAMIAAPGVTRFVGAGGMDDAVSTSNEMMEICIDHNPNFSIPTWDFQGACLGIDARKVVETGIEPVINTGIAHKEAGVGQIGAGTVRAPLACFEKAIEAYAVKLGLIEPADNE